MSDDRTRGDADVQIDSELERWKMRKRTVFEWRRFWEPRDTSRYTKTSAELVPALLGKLGLNDRLNEDRIVAAWAGLVGPFIARHSRPMKLERRTLVVGVLQPAILYTLDRELKGEVLAKLQAEFGKDVIRGIRFQHG